MIRSAADTDATAFTVGERRRRRRAGEPDPLALATLILNPEGVLLWHDGLPGGGLMGRRGRRDGFPAPEGEVVEVYQVEKLAPNEIGAALRGLDSRLNPKAGLHRWDGATWSPATPAKGKKRRLLIIHGTFSRNSALTDSIGRAPNGPTFLKRIRARYDEILGWEHPTLSVSPVLNAFDIAGALAHAEGPLDVIAHSRGGLVARWLLEGFGLPAAPCTAVLVGSPLGGTSLASPARLRDAMSVLSNLGVALKAAGAATTTFAPFLAAPLGLLQVVTAVVSAAAKVPLVDAAVAMIPGLAGQSRAGDNPELARIKGVSTETPPTYFIVRSNFESEAAGWQFWKWFRIGQLADAAADRVFPGPNDLVVDTASMTEIPGRAIPTSHLLDFGTSDTVHHTNYFAQAQTLDFIADQLKCQ
jgi:hypothetical protein